MHTHSPLGASGAKRWLACSGSYLLARELAEAGQLSDNSSEFANLGTDAHDAAAECLLNDLEAYEVVSKTYGSHTAGKEIELNALSVFLAECREHMGPDDTVLIEKHIDLPNLHPLMRGTMDFASYRPHKRLVVRDYKNGAGVAVDAEENDQVLYYAFLVASSLSLSQKENGEFPVSIGIVQPRIAGAEPVKTWETTLGHVLAYGVQTLLPKMRQLSTKQDISEDDFVTGEHCQFCPVLLECPKTSAAFETFSEAEDPDMLTDAELSGYYDRKDAARRFMTALEAKVKGRLMDKDNKITTAKLVKPRADRVWSDVAAPMLIENLGDEAFNPRVLKSPAQIEALGSRGKELAKELAYKPDNPGFSVAHISDKRPAINPVSVADTFKAYEEPTNYEGF